MFGMVEAMIGVIQRKVPKVQRGITSAAGNVTISAVNMNRAVVFSKSKGSAGYVAARGNITGSVNPSYLRRYPQGQEYTVDSDAYGTGDLTAAISGGSTDLTVKEYSARLTSSTTIYCDGPVEWQIIEFN